MASLKFKNIYKIYDGGVEAVKDFNLDIKDNEFIVFVGPSGCGKSTTLRMVAGLEEISKGELYIDDVVVNDIHSKDRDIAMVFQNYALYPHMSVYENMAYSLKLRKVAKDEIDKKIKEVAKILDLEEFLERKPKALSGGQRQRVALGRAIVRKPNVFLMDEPLSNLDAKLRAQTRTEIIKLHELLKTTFIYVTHDQTEAMTMGDRIVIMSAGIIQQVDTPNNVYFNPKNIFVASFIGSPQMNLFDCMIREKEGEYKLEVLGNTLALPKKLGERIKAKSYLNKELKIGVRPEHIRDKRSKEDMKIKGTVEFIEMLGSDKLVHISVNSNSMTSLIHSDYEVYRNKEHEFYIDPSKIHFFDKDTEESIFYED